MILLALSCLQGRPQLDAAKELMALGPDGLQLTPGNTPQDGMREFVLDVYMEGGHVCLHHGFSYDRYRAQVWSGTGRILVDGSVHPPKKFTASYETFWLTAQCNVARNGVPYSNPIETMYGGYALSSVGEIERAMEMNMALAVDVSHAFIAEQDYLPALDGYRHISEIHISANNGRADLHQPITRDTHGMAWARAQLERDPDIPVVLECHLHKLSDAERRAQLDLVRELLC